MVFRFFPVLCGTPGVTSGVFLYKGDTMSTLISKLDVIEQRHAEVMERLSESAVLADPAQYQRFARLHAE